MVAELVETSRLWGRDAARIEPQWVEPLAEHLVKRTYSEPRWERGRAQVVATERVTLYGLPIVTGRTVAYGRIDPELARELFIRRALVEGDWETRHAFFADNRRCSRRSRRSRSARAGATCSSTTRRCSTSSTSASPPTSSPARTSTAGGATSAARDPDLLTYTRELLVDPAAADALDPPARPDGLAAGRPRAARCPTASSRAPSTTA